MYGYKWVNGENGIFKLDVSVAIQKEIRPVFKEELDFFEMYKVWEYPDTDAPLLWAEGIRKYVLNGEVIAEAKGGSFYEKPKIVVKNNYVKKFEPININRLIEVNHSLMDGLVQRSIQFIRLTYEQYETQGYKFVAAFSGGKDSIVILDLVQRALAPDQFIVVFGDTGMELSDTYAAVEKAKEHYPNLSFQIAASPFDAKESWKEFGPPGRRLRWCCGIHKSVPTLVLLRTISDGENVKAIVFDGVRAEESEQRSTYDELSEGKKHINQVNCSPILKWSTSEIYLYILERNILFNRAYRLGLFNVEIEKIRKDNSPSKLFNADAYFGAELKKRFIPEEKAVVKRLIVDTCWGTTQQINYKFGELKKSVEKTYHKFGLLIVAVPSVEEIEKIKTTVGTLLSTDDIKRLMVCVMRYPLPEETLKNWYELVANGSLAQKSGNTVNANSYQQQATDLIGAWVSTAIGKDMDLSYGTAPAHVYTNKAVISSYEKIVFKVFPAASEGIIKKIVNNALEGSAKSVEKVKETLSNYLNYIRIPGCVYASLHNSWSGTVESLHNLSTNKWVS